MWTQILINMVEHDKFIGFKDPQYHSLMLDWMTMEYKLERVDLKRARTRIYLGEFSGGEFKWTVDNMKDLSEEDQVKVKNFIKKLFKE